ncbi:MAG TPA: PASTA domain-containing protein [Candidatus Acidoferrum sp.]|nr:PASTA domain-containing protein [Candidatus Acidoferrum sp.]
MTDEPQFIEGQGGGQAPQRPEQQSFLAGLKERLEWALRMSLLVFILAAAAFLSAITAMRVAIHGREVGMPNLVGKNVTEAGAMLRSVGLGLRVADHVYSDMPINVVVRQTPPPGMQMKVAQQAHVVLSLGQRALQIPAIEGNSLRVSRIELLRGALQVGEVSNLEMPDQPADTVVIQNPKPGAGAATPRVDVLVSAGPHENSFVMPHLVGMNEEEARRRLEASGIKLKVSGVSAPQWPHGAVIDQSPLAGRRLTASTQVELTTAD